MADPPELYTGLPGGRVLDVGTGRGGFIEELVANLQVYDEIVGIDIDAGLADEFVKRFESNPRIGFQVMDATAMSFEDESFDTAAVAGSLHHLSDPQAGLREMMRVLRPGGHLIVVEMYRDGQAPTQQTHVLLHHWWAAVDRTRGVSHRETYRRQEVVDMISGLGLSGLEMRDEKYLHEDPKDADQIARLEAGIDQYLELAAGHPDLIAQGAAIRQRLVDVGFHLASVVVALGQKPNS